MLYTGKEIAQMYSSEDIKLTENYIRRLASKGLKHIRGPHNTFLYKKEWFENYLEEQADKNQEKEIIEEMNLDTKGKKKHTRMKKYNFEELKVI